MEAKENDIAIIGGCLYLAVDRVDNMTTFQGIRPTNEMVSVNIEEEENAGDTVVDEEGSNEQVEGGGPHGSSGEVDIEEDEEEETRFRDIREEVDSVIWEETAIAGRLQDQVVEEDVNDQIFIHVPNFYPLGLAQCNVDIDAWSGLISLVSTRYGERSRNFRRRVLC